METTLKDQVKNIFKSNTFEVAMELTKDLYGEYLRVYGIKSWNSLAAYYKKANIQSGVYEVAEPEPEYHHDEEGQKHEDPGIIEGYHENISSKVDEKETSPVTFSYMVYKNVGDDLVWFGHKENFYNHGEGSIETIIRNHSCGVSEALIVAVADMTYYQIALFHKCYKAISKRRCGYDEQYKMVLTCFRHLSEMANEDLVSLPKGDQKSTDAILNFQV